MKKKWAFLVLLAITLTAVASVFVYQALQSRAAEREQAEFAASLVSSVILATAHVEEANRIFSASPTGTPHAAEAGALAQRLEHLRDELATERMRFQAAPHNGQRPPADQVSNYMQCADDYLAALTANVRQAEVAWRTMSDMAPMIRAGYADLVRIRDSFEAMTPLADEVKSKARRLLSAAREVSASLPEARAINVAQLQPVIARVYQSYSNVRDVDQTPDRLALEPGP
jgi:hypothetical protein